MEWLILRGCCINLFTPFLIRLKPIQKVAKALHVPGRWRQSFGLVEQRKQSISWPIVFDAVSGLVWVEWASWHRCYTLLILWAWFSGTLRMWLSLWLKQPLPGHPTRLTGVLWYAQAAPSTSLWHRRPKRRGEGVRMWKWDRGPCKKIMIQVSMILPDIRS